MNSSLGAIKNFLEIKKCPFIRLLALCLCITSHFAPAQDGASLVKQTRTHLDVLAKSDGFSGVVLIAKDGKPVFRKAYGFANLPDRISNQENTKFNIASMGKMFTGVAVMQLAQNGKISLTEKIGKYLPDYPNKEVRDSVTIQQLLTHTSGMGNFWDELSKVPRERYRSLSDYLPLFANQPLLFPPGSKMAYSNSGYIVLGLIIEAVTGETYFDYVKEHIYKPAGMTDTDAYELDYAVPNMAIGYTRALDRPGVMMNNLYTDVVKGSSPGGSFSTADDLLNFSNALMQDKLLSKDSTKELTRGRVKYRTGQYAYGFVEENVNGHRVIGHGGGATGIADELMIVTDSGYKAVILTNGDVDNFWDVQAFIRKQLIGPAVDVQGFYFTENALETTIKNGYDAGVRALQNNPDKIMVRSGMIEQRGYKLLWERKNEQAIAIFKLNVFADPEDSYPYSGLAEAYLAEGNKELAVENYKKSLAIDPDDGDIKKKLDKLTAH